MITPRTLILSIALGCATAGGATYVIHRNYQAALKHELEESTGQVGQLRLEAQALRDEQETRRREIEAIRTDIKTAEGLPAPFSNMLVNGKSVAKAELLKGQTVSRGK